MPESKQEKLERLVKNDGLRLAGPTEVGWNAKYFVGGELFSVRVTDTPIELASANPGKPETPNEKARGGKISM